MKGVLYMNILFFVFMHYNHILFNVIDINICVILNLCYPN